VPASKAEAMVLLQSFGSQVDASWLRPGSQIWVTASYDDKTEEAYYRGKVLNVGKEEVEVEMLGAGQQGKASVPLQDVYAVDTEAEEGVPDMSKLTHLSEASLLVTLRKRYQRHEIYTCVGPTLLALNPYAPLPALYSPEAIAQYSSLPSQPPHIYGLSALALGQLWESRKNQAVIISGESGAGKTENTKYAMRFLAVSQGGNSGIEGKVLQCNPILESFGNAKTLRNDNSSRFGKYVRLFFSNQTVSGASISSYLLEKTRVVRQAAGERNFHIFYSFLCSAGGDLLRACGLEADCSKYRYLSQSGVYRAEGVDDAVWFGQVMEAFGAVGVGDREIRSLWGVLGAVLNLGNVDFDDTAYVEDSAKACRWTEETRRFGDLAARLLGIPTSRLESALTNFTRKVGSSEIASPIAKTDCQFFRDALAKSLYDRLFAWLVRRLNESLSPAVPSSTYIGLLDIFGFELLQDNSFEQFCINYTNEKLQQLYVSYVFKAEAEEFKTEGLGEQTDKIKFVDNQPIIDLLEGYPVGIFSLVDEACSVSSDDKKLLANIVKQHKKNQFFAVPRMDKEKFIVFHTAKDVDYKVTGFRVKNMDELRPELAACALTSTDPLISSLFVKSEEESAVKAGKFLGPKFRKQMQSLMEELHSCDCHFLRCVKPNEDKAEWKLVPRLVLQQIQYLGVLDTIKVRRESYPVRKVFQSLYQRYEELAPAVLQASPDWRALSQALLTTVMPGIGAEYYLVGSAKVFLKMEAFALLEHLRAGVLKGKIESAEKIQRAWKTHKCVQRFHSLRHSIVTIQRKWRAGSQRASFLALRGSVLHIQAWWRSIQMHRRYVALTDATITVQRYARAKLERLGYLKKRKSVIRLQRFAKDFVARKRNRKVRICRELVETRVLKAAWDRVVVRMRARAAVAVQRVWRGYKARRRNRAVLAQLQRSLLLRKQIKAVVCLQAWFRGLIVRLRLQRVTRAARYIQGFFKAKWTYALFHKTRVEAGRIKSAMRAFALKRRITRERLEEYIEHEAALLYNQKLVEFSELFSQVEFDMGNRTEQLRAISELAESSALQNKLLLTTQGSLAMQAKPVSPFHLERLYLFARVVDLDLLTDLSLIYDPLWSQQLESLTQECSLAEEHLLSIQVAGTHSCALTSRGRLFAWGWNDRHQLGSGKPSSRPRLVDSLKDTRVVQVTCGNDHTLALDDAGQVWAFGDNSKGQLGQGHYRDGVGAVKVGVAGKVVLVASGANQSFAVTGEGVAYMWPYETYGGERRSTPIPMPTSSPVLEISLGLQFCVFVVSSGLVYSFGQSNDEGQQGHGDRLPRASPEVIAALRETGEKVESASCGFKHVVCRTHLGKVYTWGCGKYGQLGHSTTASQLSPRLLYIRNPTQRLKIVQSQAGWRHSIIMLENRTLMWFGSNGQLEGVSRPEKMRLWEKLPELFKQKALEEEFAPVKVMTSWSRSACVTTLIVADVRHLKLSKPKLQSALSLLAEKWKSSSSNSHTVEPPYIESIASLFPAIYLKANSQTQRVKPRPRPGKADEVTVMKRRIQELLEKREDQWTEEDRQFHAEITKKPM